MTLKERLRARAPANIPSSGVLGYRWCDLTFPLPISLALNVFSAVAPWRPMRDPVVADFGRSAFGLTGSALREWYTEAWWGHHANTACYNRILTPGREDEVLALVQPVDWGPFEALLRRKQGVIVASCHLGIPGLIPRLFSRSGRPMLKLYHAQDFQHPMVETPPNFGRLDYARLYLRCLAHLREGGRVSVTSDSPANNSDCSLPCCGRDIRVSLGSAVLARISGAPVLPGAALWDGDRIRVQFGPPIQPGATDAAAWDREWMRQYLDWMENLLRDNPRAMQFHHYLPWLEATAKARQAA